MWNKEDFIKEGYFYRGPKKEWEFEDYGFYPRGLGDIIYNTLRMIIETDDKSDWAHASFFSCLNLLITTKRWPDSMNKEVSVGNGKYRSQRSMTRDPWIMFYCCAIHLDEQDLILYTKPQLWLYRPKLWAWRRKLLGKWNMYNIWNFMSRPKKDYVITLNYYMDWAIKQIKEL